MGGKEIGPLENEADAPTAAGAASRPAQELSGERVCFSALRVPPGGQLQSHLQGYPSHPSPTARDTDSVSTWEKRGKFPEAKGSQKGGRKCTKRT